jgi:hypothetical protein
MEKTNIRFRLAMFVSIHMACSLYKLVHVAKYLHCSKLFAIRKSIVHLILHQHNVEKSIQVA